MFFIIASVQIVFSTNYLYQAQKFEIISTLVDVLSVKGENRILWKMCQPWDDQAHNLMNSGITLWLRQWMLSTPFINYKPLGNNCAVSLKSDVLRIFSMTTSKETRILWREGHIAMIEHIKSHTYTMRNY